MNQDQHHSVARLNVLLAEDRPHAPEHWITQLPRLLEPQGVVAYIVRSRSEAIDLVNRVEVHAVILDLATPLGHGQHWPGGAPRSSHPYANPSDTWMLQLCRRLQNRPPVIVVRGRAYSQRQVQRLLQEALSLGVFSVVNPPVDLEHLLVVLRRVIDHQYRGHWPGRFVRRTVPQNPDHPN